MFVQMGVWVWRGPEFAFLWRDALLLVQGLWVTRSGPPATKDLWWVSYSATPLYTLACTIQASLKYMFITYCQCFSTDFFREICPSGQTSHWKALWTLEIPAYHGPRSADWEKWVSWLSEKPKCWDWSYVWKWKDIINSDDGNEGLCIVKDSEVVQ